jgi:CCR4-NOT transcription complex subunit 6
MRRFIPTGAASAAPVAARLRVVSWNVLAERWTRDGQHDYVTLGSGAGGQLILDGAARTARVLDALASIDPPPDVCCLQEVQRDVHTGPLQQWMAQRGYSGAWVAKSGRLRGEARDAAARAAVALAGVGGKAAGGAGGGEDGEGGSNSESGSSGSGSDDGGGGGGGGRAEGEQDAEGVALLWRDVALECLHASAFRFADAAPASRLLSEFGDAAVAAVLRHRSSGRALVAASAHLFWDPKRPEVKARQAGLLARRCASLARRHAAAADAGESMMLPVVIGGDFNSMPPAELLLQQEAAGTQHQEQQEQEQDQEAAVARAARAAAAATLPGSGVYRLLTMGTLPPSHPDHPFFAANAAAAAAATASAAAVDDDGAATTTTNRRSQRNGGGRRRRRPAALSTRGLRLVTAHAAARGGAEPSLTTRTATFSGALDHIFIGPRPAEPDQQQQQQQQQPQSSGGDGRSAPSSASLPWHVEATLGLPALQGPIPDAEWPSDHLPVGADLLLLA